MATVTRRYTAYFSYNRQGKTGLTVTVDAYNVNSGIQVVTAQAATEIGDGFYKYQFTETVGQTYVFVFKTTNEFVDQQHAAGGIHPDR